MSSYASSILNFINREYPYVDGYEMNGTKSLNQQNEANKWIPLPEEPVSMIVYPNPTTGNVEVNIPESSMGINSIELYNMEGRLLFKSQSTTNSTTLDLSDLDQGLYLLKVQAIVNNIAVNLTELLMVSK
jgi:hypothetical protein